MRWRPNNLLCFRTCVVQHSRGIRDLCVSPILQQQQQQQQHQAAAVAVIAPLLSKSVSRQLQSYRCLSGRRERRNKEGRRK